MDLEEVLSLEKLFFGLLLCLLLTIFLYLAFSGLFTPITVSTLEPDTGPITLAYKTLVGPYKEAGELYTESYCLLPHRKQLGIYYDDPEGTPPAELRCAVGPVLAQGGEAPVKEEMEKMKENGFRIVHLPDPSFVVSATFPFATTFSIYIAIYRVYPQLRDYIAERRLCAYPAMELYSDSSIVFMMPLSRQDEFFVAEFQEDQVSIATTDIGESILEKATDCNEKERESPASSNGSDNSTQSIEEDDMLGDGEDGWTKMEVDQEVAESLGITDSEGRESLPAIDSETVPIFDGHSRD